MITTPRSAKERNRKAGRNWLNITALFVLVVFSAPQTTWAGEPIGSAVPPMDNPQPLIDPNSELKSKIGDKPTLFEPQPVSDFGPGSGKTSTEFLAENQPLSLVTEEVIEIPPVSLPEMTLVPEPQEPEPSNLSGGAVLYATPVKKKEKEEQKDSDHTGKTTDEKSSDYSGFGITTGNLKDVNVKDVKPLVDPTIDLEKEDPFKIETAPPVEIVSQENLVSRLERNHFLRSTAKDLIFAKETKRKIKNQRGNRGATVTVRRRHPSFE